MKLPTLYQKTETGAIQSWTIEVDGSTITTTHGQVGGKLQTTSDIIKKGKNTGKINATTPETQAENEALSNWNKKKKKGYVEDIKKAEKGQVDTTVIAGGIEPMLAHKYRDHAAKIKYPCFSQPKLDGIRCIAVVEPEGKVTLWSRTRKPITSVPHIVNYLATKFSGVKTTTYLDGELYSHSHKKDFEKIVSLVRQETPAEGHEIIEYHVYDTVLNAPFKDRTELIKGWGLNGPVKTVETILVNNENDLFSYMEDCLNIGYEGCMARNAESTYENKRSYGLQKLKVMEDKEFEVVGVEECRGKRAGQAILVCKTDKGKTFGANPKGSDALRQRILKDAKRLVGKMATVRFQNLTADGIPRFPVAITIRDYE